MGRISDIVYCSELLFMQQRCMKSIGIIGAENSHTIAIATEINLKQHFPGFSVTHVWGETSELAEKASREGEIPNIVSEPTDMLGNIDAVICDHRHAKYHLDSVREFVADGVPTFVDKPFCYRSKRGREFLEHARLSGTPVTSFSVRCHQKSFLAFVEEIKSIGDLSAGTTYGACDLDSPYGGVFFYGIHQVDMALHAFGSDVDKVSVIQNTDSHAIGHLLYPDGKIIALHFVKKEEISGFAISAAGSDGYVHRTLVGDESPHRCGVEIFTKMIETGTEPIPHKKILDPIVVLEALERSIESGKVERVDKI